jgi:hypothetical protein
MKPLQNLEIRFARERAAIMLFDVYCTFVSALSQICKAGCRAASDVARRRAPASPDVS